MGRIFEKMDHPQLTEIVHGWKEGSFALHDKTVEVYGVAHHPDTLKVQEFRDKLESAIDRSSVVFLELVPVGIEASFEHFKAKAETLEVPISEQELRIIFEKITKDNPCLEFFKEILHIAAEEGKPVACSDPNMDVYAAMLLNKHFIGVEETKMFLLLASLGTIVTMKGFERLFRTEISKQHIGEAESRKYPSRRAFLKGATGVAVGAGLFGSLSITASVNEELKQQGRTDNPFGAALYSLYDYREVCAARGLERLSRNISGDDPIVVIYGHRHFSGIEYYATHSIERDLRSAVYTPFITQIKGDLKRYIFRDGQWVEEPPY